MTYMLPILDLATDLHEWSKEYCESRKLQLPSRDECVDVVVGLLDDCISERMIWCDNQNRLDEELEEKFPWYTPVSEEETDRTSSDFYYYVIDHIFLKVQYIVNNIMPSRTWHVWHVSKKGKDVFVEQGDDYRVIDWERRMASGEWSDDD